MTDAVIGEYGALTVLRQHGDTLVIRANALDGTSVIIKTHAQRLPTVETRARLRREYDSATAAAHRHLARARELIDQPSRSALVLDDHGGTRLADLTAADAATMDLTALVRTMVEVGDAAVALHAAGMAHLAIDAEHIEVSPRGAALVDLYDACAIGVVPRRRAHARHLAPEQHGREPIAADAASDQYALAGTFVEMGEVLGLFDATGSGAAVDQRPLDDTLRAIVDRARAAVPTERYRSMLGMVGDLRRWLAGDRLFLLGSHDMALSWRNPQRLVGRDGVLDAIADAVTSAALARIPRVIVVRGPEGSGRSMVLQRFCEQLGEGGVLNGLGRFDPGGADPPLRAPIDAMRQIVDQVLAGSEPMVAAIRSELAARLGSDVSMAEQIFPSLTHLLPPAASATSAAAGTHGSPVETLARAERAVLNSVGSIARHAVPLVMALDDADRADAASIMSLRLMGRGTDAGPTVVVLAARDDEDSVLAPALRRLVRDGVDVVFVDLPALTERAVADLIADGTGSDAADIAPLAHAVWQRTQGVPGLVVDDVWALASAGELRADADLGRWAWSATALAGAEATTLDVAALRRLGRLDDTVRRIVLAAALCERAADDEVIAAALELEPAAVHAGIEHAVEMRIVVRRPGIDGSVVATCADGGVRRAVLAAVDDHERHRLEHRLARALRTTPSGSLSSERRFEIVRLLGAARDLLDDPAEREDYARLVADAARDAHRSAGYQVALDLQLQAIASLDDRIWDAARSRALAFDLHLHAAEHALMLGRTALVDDLMDRITLHRPTAEQRVQMLRVLSSRWWTQQDTVGGLAEARALLRELGEPIPESPTWADVGREFVATRIALRNIEPESFLTGPRLTDPRLQAATETMLRCVHLAYVSDPITHTVLALRGTRMTVRHGVSPGSSYFLTAYAMLSCAFRTDVERALRFGRVGLQLADGVGGTLEAMVRFAYNGFVRHWGEPLATTIEPMVAQYRTTLAAHERGYGLTSGAFAVLHGVLAGQPLESVDALAASCSEDFAALGEHAFQMRVDLVRQAITDLREGYASTDPLAGSLFDAPAWLAAKRRHNELALNVHTLRATIAACHDDRDALRRSVEAGAPMLRTAPGQAIVAQHWFLAGLAAADACAAATNRRDRARERVRAERALRWLRSWRDHAPSADHRSVLVEAAIADAAGHHGSAMECYERAVHLARERDALLDLGIAAQRAAEFHRRRAGSSLVHHYVQLAHDAWQAWGATAAANGVNRRFPTTDGLSITAAGGPPGTAAPRPRRHDPAASTSTNETFAQASMLIGQELEVHEFLERLLEILLRHAAATRGFLVLQSAEGPVVEVAAHRIGDLVEGPSMPSRNPGDHPDLCVPALSYTLRTHEVLSLVDPANDHRFRSDSSLRARAPRALLCLPIGRPSGTNGVLVMESDTFSHAFDDDSVEALRVLSTQAIAAIENVRLSSDLGSLANDVANLRARAAALTAQAETDPLTGVANRNGLQAGFQATMKALGAEPVGDQPRQLGVLFCDLDGFKSVNDRHGHSVGDVVLREVATRLRRVVRNGDIVARVGGDEFVILSVDVATAELHAIAERALLELRRPLGLADGPRISISASIGVARADLDSLGSTDDVDAVLEIADQAMYRAKHAGKDQVAHT